MKTITLLFLLLLSFISCKKGDDNPATPNPATEEISDSDFKKLVTELPGKTIEISKLVKYTSIAGKDGSNELSQLVTEPVTCTGIPTLINQLNSGSGYEFYKYTKENSAEIKFMGFGGNIGRKELLLIKDYVRYKNVNCGGVTKRVGIGLRCYIHVKGIKASFKGSYADIAANAQLNNMSANFSLKSLGFAMEGNLIADDLTGNDYNVDNFGKLDVTFNNVLRTLKNDNPTLTISPVLLPLK